MSRKDPYAALRYPEFRHFVLAQFLFTIAILIQEVAISFYLYELTDDPFSLGLVGLFEAIPYISLALFGGYLADRYDKRNIARISFTAVILTSVFLMWATHPDPETGIAKSGQPTFIYASVFIFGIARGFFSPALNALKPFLVKPEHYANSASWSSQFWQTGVIAGPAAGGFLYAWTGLGGTLLIVIGLLVCSVIFVSLIGKKPLPPHSGDKMLKSLKEGILFVRRNKLLWYSILLDMLTVLFGGVVALLPVFAKDILYVGPEGLGLLRAAPGIGAVITVLATAYFPPTGHAWRNMLLATFFFGLSTLLFALSTNFYLSVIALLLTGSFDSISVVVRSTILQVLPPDNMRGRVASVNGIFVSTSNELGAFESGTAAKLFGTVPSVLLGAGATFAVVGYIFTRSKELFRVRLD